METLHQPSLLQEEQMEGWRLDGQQHYQPIAPEDKGWMWSEQLGCWLGTWEGIYLNLTRTWLRLYDARGQLIPLKDESAEASLIQARTELAQAQVEVAQLKAVLGEKGITPPTSGSSPP